MMKDDEILSLVRQAVDVDDLEAAEQGMTSLADLKPPPRSRVLILYSLISFGAVAASFGLFLVLADPAVPAVHDLRVEYAPVRGPASEWRISGTLSRPAYVCVIMIDERLEPWAMPVETGNGIWQHQSLTLGLYIPAYPNSEGIGARGRFLLLLFSIDSAPTADELLEVIPDPVASSELASAEIIARLEQIASDLENQFHMSARIVGLP